MTLSFITSELRFFESVLFDIAARIWRPLFWDLHKIRARFCAPTLADVVSLCGHVCEVRFFFALIDLVIKYSWICKSFTFWIYLWLSIVPAALTFWRSFATATRCRPWGSPEPIFLSVLHQVANTLIDNLRKLFCIIHEGDLDYLAGVHCLVFEN